MSNFAFGTYRISEHNPQHIEALREAINSGIRLIDTSSNYMDGSAERAIAIAMREFDDNIKNEIEIVSKVGYIQGSNMEKHKKTPFDNVVEYSEECFHSISPTFIETQLTDSLKRLELKKINCYLLHNPEYYLYDAINKNIGKDERLDEIYNRIYKAFIQLEKEVKNKRIESYGISSNSFSIPSSNDEFLPYEDLVTLAEKASKEVGNTKHNFTTIELPINILEKNGLHCASWAKENNLRVLANRPLNANYNNVMYRLAQYDESIEYYNYLNELLNVSDNKTLKSLYNLIEQLDDSKHKFAWIGDYDTFLYSQIVPHIKKTLENIDEENRETLFNFIDLFLQEYRKMVAYECGEKTKETLKSFFKNSINPLQETALKYLADNEDIDYVLVGMRKSSYVNQILSLDK